MGKNVKSLVYKILGYALSIIPAFVCTIFQFPLWIQDKNSCISLLSLLLLGLCILPLWRMIKEGLKSPSAWKLWLILLILFTVVEHIIVGLRVIALVACPTSALGALFFRLAKQNEEKKEE